MSVAHGEMDNLAEGTKERLLNHTHVLGNLEQISATVEAVCLKRGGERFCIVI